MNTEHHLRSLLDRYYAQARRDAASNELIPDDAIGRLVRYIDLTLQWNERFNLVRVRDGVDFIDLHVMDAIAVSPMLAVGIDDGLSPSRSAPESLVDVGSGVGIPGVVCAILRPETVVTVVDSQLKRSRFLEHIRIELELDNLVVLRQRIEQLDGTSPTPAIIARGFSSLATLIAVTSKIRTRETLIHAMKTAQAAGELADVDRTAWHILRRSYELPSVSRDRELVTLIPVQEAEVN